MNNIRITCPVCLRKLPYKELPDHLVSEEERKLIFQAIKEAEEK